MKTASFLISFFSFRNLGACPLCMRISFSAMTLSWLIVFGAILIGADLSVTVFGALSSALTILWLGHVIARAMRSLPPKPVETDARRTAMRTFGRAMVGAAAVSVGLISLPKPAEANECGQACSKANDNCPSGCTCWWELKKCVKLG